jgi:hypothetical protein
MLLVCYMVRRVSLLPRMADPVLLPEISDVRVLSKWNHFHRQWHNTKQWQLSLPCCCVSQHMQKARCNTHAAFPLVAQINKMHDANVEGEEEVCSTSTGYLCDWSLRVQVRLTGLIICNCHHQNNSLKLYWAIPIYWRSQNPFQGRKAIFKKRNQKFCL